MNVALIDGHPTNGSFCQALAQAYSDGAAASGHSVTRLALRDMAFEINLRHGYKQRVDLEPDLQAAQAALKAATLIVVVTPIWWGGPPALLKGFFDRTFLPGFAFKYRENSVWWDKYFVGKRGRIIATSDAPAGYMRWVRGDSTVKMIRSSILDFVGVKPVRVTRIGNVKWCKPPALEKHLAHVHALGRKGR